MPPVPSTRRPSTPAHPTRREVVATLAAGIAVAAAPHGARAAQVELEAFLDLSARLTGAPRDALDQDAGSLLLSAFQAGPRGPALAALVADPQSEPEFAREIVAAWYSGLVQGKDGDIVATYDGALLWRALNFTKPLGYCGGETGYWSQPPAG
jgi:hypothetical protein